MSTRKITLFYALLIAVASLAVGMVLASRLDLAPSRRRRPWRCPPMNSAPLTGPVDATPSGTSPRATPMVVNIRTRAKRKAQDMTDFFGGERPLRPVLRPTAGPGRRPRPEAARPGGGSGGHRLHHQRRTASSSPTTTSSRARPRSTSRFGEDQTDQELYEAKLVGRDPLTDSALIQLTEKPTHAAARSEVRRLVPDAAGRLGDGDRQPVRPRAHRHRRRHQRRRSGRSRWPSSARRTCSRPTPRSTPATRAGRC